MGGKTVATLVGIIAVATTSGCAHSPCVTGFEVGISGGEYSGRQRDFDQTYAGGHATAYFDTTGACSVVETD